MAVLGQHGALRKTQEPATRVFEFRRPDEHRTIDMVALARIRVDRSTTVDQRVEEGQRAFESESLGADLENQERRVAGRLHVEGDELGVLEWRAPADLRCIDRDLLPRDRLRGAAWLQVQRFSPHEIGGPAPRAAWRVGRRLALISWGPWGPFGRAHRASASARRAHAISSPLSARSRRTAAA